MLDLRLVLSSRKTSCSSTCRRISRAVICRICSLTQLRHDSKAVFAAICTAFRHRKMALKDDESAFHNALVTAILSHFLSIEGSLVRVSAFSIVSASRACMFACSGFLHDLMTCLTVSALFCIVSQFVWSIVTSVALESC